MRETKRLKLPWCSHLL